MTYEKNFIKETKTEEKKVLIHIMENPKSKILEYYRLRPQKKGKLPNFTKDFEAYSEQIDQVIKNKVQFSFNLNKFGIEKSYKLNIIKKKSPEYSKVGESLMDSSTISIPSHYGCDKYLRYNETIISPDHKIKTRNKILKKLKKQQSEPSFKEMKNLKDEKIKKTESMLPKITLTTREKSEKSFLFNKENLFESRTTRIHNHDLATKRNESYVKLYHIVTMGRKEMNS